VPARFYSYAREAARATLIQVNPGGSCRDEGEPTERVFLPYVLDIQQHKSGGTPSIFPRERCAGKRMLLPAYFLSRTKLFAFTRF